MATSPTRKTRTAKPPVSPYVPMPELGVKENRKELGNHLSFLARANDAIRWFAYQLGLAGGKKVAIPIAAEHRDLITDLGGRPGSALEYIFTKAALRSLVSDFKRAQTVDTNKFIAELTKRRPGPRRLTAVMTPKVYDNELIDFLLSISDKFTYPGESSSIFDQMTFKNDNISTPNSITTILTTYVYSIEDLPFLSASNREKMAERERLVNTDPNLPEKSLPKMNRQNLGLNDEMKKGLAGLINTVRNQADKKPFDPDDFKYISLNRIPTAAIVPESRWNDDQLRKMTYVDESGRRVEGMRPEEKTAYKAVVRKAETEHDEEMKRAEKQLAKDAKKNLDYRPPANETLDYNALGNQMLDFIRDQERVMIRKKYEDDTRADQRLGPDDGFDAQTTRDIDAAVADYMANYDAQNIQLSQPALTLLDLRDQHTNVLEPFKRYSDYEYQRAVSAQTQ